MKSSYLKIKISIECTFVPYYSNLSDILTCDAGSTSVAGLLKHITGDQERPNAFALTSVANTEQNYSQLYREAPAIVFSIKFSIIYSEYINSVLLVSCRSFLRQSVTFRRNQQTPQRGFSPYRLLLPKCSPLFGQLGALLSNVCLVCFE